MKNITIVLFILILFSRGAWPQEIVLLKNPSFEAAPKYATLPGGWQNCAFNGETPPDIHPVKNGAFQVNMPPKDGSSYVGLVSRDFGTTESIGQQLLSPLKKGRCYEFSIWLSRSKKLMAIHRKTRKQTNFNRALQLTLWGGVSPCGKKYLLGTTPAIDHTDWKKYQFRFQPAEDITWISFEAAYTEGSAPYNGNILLDDAGPFLPIDCQTGESMADTASIPPPLFHYIKYKVPEKIEPSHLFRLKPERLTWRDFRIANTPDGLDSLIKELCDKTGFNKNTSTLLDNTGTGWFEIAANMRKFKNYNLLIGLDKAENKTERNRKKIIESLFSAMEIPPGRYKIISLPAEKLNGWECGHNGVWLKKDKEL